MPNIDSSVSFKRMRNFLILFCGILFILSSVILKPIYTTLYSNIIFSESFLLLLLEFLLDICDIFIYSSAFAIVSYSVFFAHAKASRLLIITYLALALIKNIIDIVMTVFLYGSIDSSDIFSVIFYIAAEAALLLAVYFTARFFKNRSENSDPLPFKKLFDSSNPIQITAIISAAILSAIKIISRIIFDIFYGLPESLFEVCSMVLFYTADILIAALAYAMIIFVIKMLHNNIQKNI